MNKPKYNTESFIKKAKEIHGNNYDYSITEFKNTRDKISYICPKHGIITQRAGSHLLGQGCSKCVYESRKNSTESFIKKAKEIHDENRIKQNLPLYDYSKTEYIGAEDYVKIICPIHGEFKQLAHVHLSGSGCIKCGQFVASIKNQRYTTKEFIEECKQVHDENRIKQNLQLYDYSKTIYNGLEYYSTFICPEHGEFEQLAITHLKGSGCPKCGNRETKQKLSYTFEQWKEKAIEIHKPIREALELQMYKYLELFEKDNNKYLKIYCPECNEVFEQTCGNHISQKQGCPKCISRYRETKWESELKIFFDSINISYTQNERKLLSGMEIDFLCLTDTNKKVAIELDGLYWHSNIFKPNDYHINKTNKCLDAEIQLIHIFEDEWLKKSEIVKSRLKQILGVQTFKIPARKCIIKQVNPTDERLFLETNHLQGYTVSRLCYGLYFTYNNKEYLVALMSFGKTRKNLGSDGSCWELYRYCSKINFSIQGGASKLFKHFINKFNPEKVISYADRRWSVDNESNLYKKLGFQLVSNTEPNYFYVKGDNRINRFKLRKDILVSKYNCPQDVTEKDFVENVLKLSRIYDCGNLKYVWKSV